MDGGGAQRPAHRPGGIGGLAIVLLAIVLDRLTQAAGEGRRAKGT